MMTFLEDLRKNSSDSDSPLKLICEQLFDFLAEESKSSSMEDRIILGCICPALWNLRTFKEAIHEFTKEKTTAVSRLSTPDVFSIIASSLTAKDPVNDALVIVFARIFRENHPLTHNFQFTCRETADLM